MAHENDDYVKRHEAHKSAGLDTSEYLPKGVDDVMHPKKMMKSVETLTRFNKTIKPRMRPIDTPSTSKPSMRDDIARKNSSKT